MPSTTLNISSCMSRRDLKLTEPQTGLSASLSCPVTGTTTVLCPCNDPRVSTPGFPVHRPLPKLAQTRVLSSVMPSNHLILCRPLLLLSSIFPSIRVFSNELALCIRWSFSFSISPSNEYSGLISFRIDWFDPLAIQGTLESLLQHQNLKAASLWRSAFFMVQLSHPYMTTRKIIALTIWTFVGKVMSLLSHPSRSSVNISSSWNCNFFFYCNFLALQIT